MPSSFSILLDDGDLVRRVVDDEVAREPDLRRLAPQQPGAESVKRRQPDALPVLANQRLDALAHLARGLVREGHRQHLVGPGMAVADEIGDAIRDDARLPRPGAGEDEQRPIAMKHGFALFGVQLGEEVHWGVR